MKYWCHLFLTVEIYLNRRLMNAFLLDDFYDFGITITRHTVTVLISNSSQR